MEPPRCAAQPQPTRLRSPLRWLPKPYPKLKPKALHALKALDPKPQTLNPQSLNPQSLNPQTLNSQSLNPKPQTLNPRPKAPKPRTRTPQTLNPKQCHQGWEYDRTHSLHCSFFFGVSL